MVAIRKGGGIIDELGIEAHVIHGSQQSGIIISN